MQFTHLAEDERKTCQFIHIQTSFQKKKFNQTKMHNKKFWHMLLTSGDIIATMQLLKNPIFKL